jgi:hypothetical protein
LQARFCHVYKQAHSGTFCGMTGHAAERSQTPAEVIAPQTPEQCMRHMPTASPTRESTPGQRPATPKVQAQLWGCCHNQAFSIHQTAAASTCCHAGRGSIRRS